MRKIIRCSVLFAVCWAVTAGAARAADDKPAAAPMDRKALDGLLYANLREVIDHGANLYNTGDWNGCYRLWEGALMGVKPLLTHRGDLQKSIDNSIASAQQEPLLHRRAFVLRTSLDKIRADIIADYPDLKKVRVENKPRIENPGSVDDPDRRSKGKTLWDRLGGEAGVTKIVDDFVNAVVADPKVDFFRHGKIKPEADEITKMKREMVEQVSQAAGGPFKYTGPDMKKIHKDMGITGQQFDAAVGHLKNALRKNNVAEKDAATVLAAVNATRGEVVAPKKPEGKKPEEKKPGGRASIEGKILLKGQPLAGGTIRFTNKDGKAEGKIDADGSYKMEGIKPGVYKVSVKGAAVPPKYGDPATSSLTFTVMDGKQAYDITLQ
jgi:hemoglobin